MFVAKSFDYFAFNLRTDDQKKAFTKAFDGQRRGFERAITRVVARALREQGEYIVSGIERRGLVEGAVLAAEATEDMTRDLYLTIYEAVLPHFAARTFGNLKHYLPYAFTKNDERDLWLAAARGYVATEGGDLIRRVTRETVRLVRRSVDAGLDAGEGIPKIAKRIRDDWKTVVRYRALRIARTETIRASNVGSRAGAAATALPLEKEWFPFLDTNTRETHAAMAGQRRKFDDFYDVGGHHAMHPVDTRLPAEESVNCRCTEGYHVVGT